MKETLTNDKLEQFKVLGYDEIAIRQAWKEAKNEDEVIDMMLNMGQQTQQLTQPQGEDAIMEQVILDSLKQNQHNVSFELMNPAQRKRQDEVPVGLKNVGNTCYFNSLLQTYFFNQEFVKAVLSYKAPQQKSDSKKLQTSINLVIHLQSLFVSMIGSDKKYVDPTEVVKSICDDFGNCLPIGDQKDVGEFNSYFLSRIEEGLNAREQQHIYQGEGESTLLRSHSSILTEESLVYKLFFGKSSHSLKYSENGVEKCNTTEDLFNFIPLDVKMKNIYDAIDNFVVNQIDNYRNESDQLVEACKYNWIKESPQTLSFQIQRLLFDKDRLESIQINDLFKFDSEIYIDRFLLQNQQVYLDIRKKNEKLKQEQKDIETQLHSINQFNGTNNLEEVLACTLEFLNIQQNKNDNLFFYKDESLAKSQQMIQKYIESIRKKKEQLLSRYAELEAQIQSSFNNLKQHKYNLQSILIHDGMANSGHYYAYIKDVQLKTWFKFNDIHVSRENEEKVILEAMGGKGVQNAYLLVYVRNDIYEKESQLLLPPRRYRTSESNEWLRDGYGALVHNAQREVLSKENQLYREEIEDYNNSRIIDNILDYYQRRFEFVNEQARLYTQKYGQEKFKPQNTLNIAVFAKLEGNNDNLVKWLIADCCVRELHPTKLGIFEGQLGDRFMNKLMDKFKSLGEFKAPKPLTTFEQNRRTIVAQDYLRAINVGAIASFFLQNFIQQNYLIAVKTLYLFCKAATVLDSNSYYYKLATNMKKLLPITILQQQIIPDCDVNLIVYTVRFLVERFFSNKDSPNWQLQMSIMLQDIHELNPSADLQSLIKRLEDNEFDANIKIDEPIPEFEQFRSLIEQQHELSTWSLNTKDDLFDGVFGNFATLKERFKIYMNLQKKIDEAQIPLFKAERAAIQ